MEDLLLFPISTRYNTPSLFRTCLHDACIRHSGYIPGVCSSGRFYTSSVCPQFWTSVRFIHIVFCFVVSLRASVAGGRRPRREAPCTFLLKKTRLAYQRADTVHHESSTSRNTIFFVFYLLFISSSVGQYGPRDRLLLCRCASGSAQVTHTK